MTLSRRDSRTLDIASPVPCGYRNVFPCVSIGEICCAICGPSMDRSLFRSESSELTEMQTACSGRPYLYRHYDGSPFLASSLRCGTRRVSTAGPLDVAGRR